MRVTNLLFLTAVATGPIELTAQEPPSEPELVRITASQARRPEGTGLPWDPVVGHVRQFTADSLELDVTSKDGLPVTVALPLALITKVEVHTFTWKNVAHTGDTTRVIRRDGQTVEGRIGVQADSSMVTVMTSGRPVSLASRQVDRVLVRKSGFGRAATTGLLIGGGIGLLTALGSTLYCSVGAPDPVFGGGVKRPCGLKVGATLALTTIGGTLIGGVIGGTRSKWLVRERSWVAIPLDRLRQRPQ